MAAENNHKVQELHKAIDNVAESLHGFINLVFNNTTLEKSEPVKRKRSEKDPNAPKRNLSSYMLYSQSVRAKVAAENPDLKAVDIAKLVGEKWNKLTEKEKAPFVKQAEKEKVRYNKEAANYKTSTGTEEKKEPVKRKQPAEKAVEEPSEESAEEPTEVTEQKKAKKSKKEKHSGKAEKKSKKKNF